MRPILDLKFPLMPEKTWTLLFDVKFSNPDGEIVTRGILYKFATMNSPERSHLGRNIISPNW